MKLHEVKYTEGHHYGWSFRCLGCKCPHTVAENWTHDGKVFEGWTFNGNVEAPTFSPSILVHEIKSEDGTVWKPRCHSFVTDGRIQYLSDCGHALAGQTIEIPEWKGYSEEE